MDGVLVDNMKIHIEAFVEMGRRYNVTEAPQTDMSALNGRGNDDVMRALLPAEVIEAVNAAMAKVEAGEITVPNTVAELEAIYPGAFTLAE